MEEKLISEIGYFTLESRHILEREISEQMEGIYGWKPDGTFLNWLPVISLSKRDKVYRGKSLLADAANAGQGGIAAYRGLRVKRLVPPQKTRKSRQGHFRCA